MSLIDSAIKRLENGIGDKEMSLAIVLDYAKNKRIEEKLVIDCENPIILAKVRTIKKAITELDRILK